MTINISYKHIEPSEAIRAHVEEKMQSLEKYDDRISMVDVEVGKTTQHHQKGQVFFCRANVECGGSFVRMEREAEDLYKAIDKVRDHLREALSQNKERAHER